MLCVRVEKFLRIKDTATDMKKLTMLLFAATITLSSVEAQKIEDGKTALYYDRFTTAKDVFSQRLSKDAKDAEAIYWLGQTYLKMDSVVAAKSLYENAISNGVDAPLVSIGMGHIELLEGAKDKARQRFDQAIENTTKRKKENPEILNAIGRANADGPSTTGDPLYAIEKLKRAAELDKNNPEILVNMGINYLKLGNENGGDAYSAFNDALRIDPNYARAKYRLGKIFLSQNNKDKFEGYFVGAIESDPKFAPAYLDLYNYYSLRDVNKAKEYLEGYMANTDKDCNVDFFYADYLFRAGKYQESLAKGQAMADGACANYPRLKVLFAYNYDRLGDSLKAKENIESYLTNATPNKIQPDDYQFAVSVLKKIPGSEEAAIKFLKIALSNDTVKKNHFVYMDTIAALYGKIGNQPMRVDWLQRSFKANPNPSNFDIYNLGAASIEAENYALADSMFTVYKNKFPDQIYGYSGLAKSAIAQDKDTTSGSAVSAVTNYIKFLEGADKEKYKSLIMQNYGYLVYIHANVQKDFAAALKDLEGILAVDPENAYAKATSAQIQKILNASKASTSSSKKGTR